MSCQEIRPGIVTKDENGRVICKPIFSRIVSLFAEHNDLNCKCIIIGHRAKVRQQARLTAVQLRFPADLSELERGRHFSTLRL